MSRKRVIKVSVLAFASVSCSLALLVEQNSLAKVCSGAGWECVSSIQSATAFEKSSIKADELLIHNAWIQEMPPTSKHTAAYMVIENKSAKETALVAAKAEIAEAVELHRMVTEGNMMRMRRVDRIPLPVGKTEITGDFHIMLINLKSPLKEGDHVALTLEFEGGGSKTLQVPVKKRQGEDGQ
jgi:copper(I)-binding protein